MAYRIVWRNHTIQWSLERPMLKTAQPTTCDARLINMQRILKVSFTATCTISWSTTLFIYFEIVVMWYLVMGHLMTYPVHCCNFHFSPPIRKWARGRPCSWSAPWCWYFHPATTCRNCCVRLQDHGQRTGFELSFPLFKHHLLTQHLSI